MPKRIITAPNHDRDRSLGWLAVAWMEALTLHARGDVTGEPVIMGDDSVEFIVDAYAVDEKGRRLYDSAFYSAPKGTDKSGLAARVDMFEALGPCRTLTDEHGQAVFAEGGEVYRDPWGLGFAYEYQPGEPMGRHLVNPHIRCMATEEEQSGNTYDTVLYNFQQGPLSAVLDYPDDAGISRIKLPRGEPTRGGLIEPSSSGAESKDGGLETHVTFDETHLYNQPRLRRMYSTVTRNLSKRRKSAGSWSLETTTMYAPGENSVAEKTYELADKIEQGKVRRPRLLFHHRWGEIEPEEMDDEDKLREALVDALGEATAWVSVEDKITDIYDPRADRSDSIRFYLNGLTSTSNAWMQPAPWNARNRVEYHPSVAPPTEGDVITLGFDGSRGRRRGYSDATALVATRVHDGLQWLVDVWEQPPGASDWEVPAEEVDAAVDETFERYAVVGFFADPSRWHPTVSAWEAKYGDRLQVRAGKYPISMGMTGKRSGIMGAYIDKYEDAVYNGDMYHNGDAILTRHVLNARRRFGSNHTVIEKPEGDDSPRKIDAAIAAVYSWEARLQAVSADATTATKTKKPATFVPTVHGRGRGPRRRNRNRRARLI